MATLEQVNKDVQDLKIQTGIYEQRLNVAEEEIKHLQTESKALYEINTNVRLLAESMTLVKNDVADVKEDLKEVKSGNIQRDDKFDKEWNSVREELNEVKNLPNKSKAEWWDKVIWLVAGGFITATVTAIISTIVQ